MYIENACNKVIVEQRTRLFAAVLFFCVNLREKMFDIPACVIHLQYVPNGLLLFLSENGRMIMAQLCLKADILAGVS